MRMIHVTRKYDATIIIITSYAVLGLAKIKLPTILNYPHLRKSVEVGDSYEHGSILPLLSRRSPQSLRFYYRLANASCFIFLEAFTSAWSVCPQAVQVNHCPLRLALSTARQLAHVCDVYAGSIAMNVLPYHSHL